MGVYQLCFILLILGLQEFGVTIDPPVSLQLKWGNDNSHNYICNEHPEDQIFWVDYYGRIPSNAVIAGVKSNGSNLYIGQVYHVQDGNGIGLIPVEVLEDELVVYVANAYKVYPQDIAIKILAGATDYIEWVDTNINMPVNTISNNILVRGGHQQYYRKVYEYIGRIKKDGDTFIGRALLDTTDKNVKGLQMIYNKNGVYTIDTAGFQVLTVKKKIPPYVVLTGFNTA